MAESRTADLFDAIRQGDLARVQALVAADNGLLQVRTEEDISAAMLAVYHNEPAIANWRALAGC